MTKHNVFASFFIQFPIIVPVVITII